MVLIERVPQPMLRLLLSPRNPSVEGTHYAKVCAGGYEHPGSLAVSVRAPPSPERPIYTVIGSGGSVGCAPCSYDGARGLGFVTNTPSDTHQIVKSPSPSSQLMLRLLVSPRNPSVKGNSQRRGVRGRQRTFPTYSVVRFVRRLRASATDSRLRSRSSECLCKSTFSRVFRPEPACFF